ncbi:hypothetical protein DZF91_03670 [Actinomadura logoneensis]|uniref:PPM-type phosphatase domain-containing protein n=2 Tax=Actinomadura logoneensis TaxID=2293572 RepID=A0A372JSH4_9ACTN|nr:hypothetical protein DZF91_03670 [Actinomadura logoneensis]
MATVEFAPRRLGGGQALTRDDSWAEEMVRAGAMTPEAAHADRRAHLLTGWLGADSGGASSSVAAFAPDGPGAVLVCSDGLWNYLPEPADLAAALGAADDPVGGVRVLLDAALDAGGRDNVTVVLVPFPPPDPVTADLPAGTGTGGSVGSEPAQGMSETTGTGAGTGPGASDRRNAASGGGAVAEPTTRVSATSRESRR